MSSTSRRRLAVSGGLWSAASQVIPALGTAVLSVAAGRLLGSAALGDQSLIAYVNAATAAVVVYALNTALLQVGGRLQGEGDERSLRALTRWALGAHVASGLVVLSAMAVSAVLVGNQHVAWLVIGVVSVLDAAADGLAVRLILAEGWAPLGRLRLVFQLLGPPLGIVFIAAGYGVPGIFVGDGLAALGLLVAVAVRFRRMRGRSLVAGPAAGAAPVTPAAGDGPRAPSADRAPGAAVWGLRSGRWGPLPTGPLRWQRLRPPVPVGSSYRLFAVDALITQVVSKRVEFVVLAIFSTSTAIGMYSVAFMAVNLISMIPLGIAAAAMPLVAAAAARGELAAATRHLRLALRLGSQVALPLVALLAAVGPYAVTLVYGSGYDQAAALVPLASLGLSVAVVSGVCAQFWAGQGRLRIVIVSGLLAGAVDLAVAFSLVPSLGALGAVIANLAAQVTLAGVLLRATVTRTGAIGWRARGLVAAVVVGGVAAVVGRAVAVVVTRLVPGVEGPAFLALVVGSAAFLLTATVLAFVVRLFDPEEAQWLRPLLPRRAMIVVDRLTIMAAQS